MNTPDGSASGRWPNLTRLIQQVYDEGMETDYDFDSDLDGTDYDYYDVAYEGDDGYEDYEPSPYFGDYSED